MSDQLISKVVVGRLIGVTDSVGEYWLPQAADVVLHSADVRSERLIHGFQQKGLGKIVVVVSTILGWLVVSELGLCSETTRQGLLGHLQVGGC